MKDKPGATSPSDPPTQAIGVDWGTTGFRGFRFGDAGEVLEARSAPAGILAIDDGDFEGALLQILGDWMGASRDVPVVLSGMIGSRNGWVETPYTVCPLALEALAEHLTPVSLSDGREILIAPGAQTLDTTGVPDVMRGEEVQILGDLDRVDDGLMCLPGTHSKWALVRNGVLNGFQTHMTGEVFDVLRRHSILGKTIDHTAWDDAIFLHGVSRAQASGGLLHHLFGVRAATLMEDLKPETAGAFLSGLVIGHEIEAALEGAAEADTVIHLIGEPELVDLYARALDDRGRKTTRSDGRASARGLWRLTEGCLSNPVG